jgi:hypothetical protein
MEPLLYCPYNVFVARKEKILHVTLSALYWYLLMCGERGNGRGGSLKGAIPSLSSS